MLVLHPFHYKFGNFVPRLPHLLVERQVLTRTFDPWLDWERAFDRQHIALLEFPIGWHLTVFSYTPKEHQFCMKQKHFNLVWIKHSIRPRSSIVGERTQMSAEIEYLVPSRSNDVAYVKMTLEDMTDPRCSKGR
jgi:hypothetical protein